MEETENLGFARLDHDRARRKGAVETIFCQGKTADQVAAIFERFAAHDGCALGTRATEEQYRAVRERVPAACYNPLGRVIYLNREKITSQGAVAIVTGGTADLPVAEEAALTAEFFGAKVFRFTDVGVAGIHRLLAVIDQIRACNAAVVIAGMEGALPSVVSMVEMFEM